LKSAHGEVIEGSVLEHLLVQHLTVFFNVGEHNLIRLEGGDWNDGLDMAADRGESVAFSALYAGNLKVLSELCIALAERGRDTLSINVEVLPLLDQILNPVDYSSISDKQSHLQKYFDSVQGALSSQKRKIHLVEIASDLAFKAEWLASLIRQQEWISGEDGEGWFNGYYDNRGERVEGQTLQGTRMTLTGQVFPLMAGIASDAQAGQIIRTAKRCLYDPALRGYRLNTNFEPHVPDLGRAFAFAYGHKENGAAFSHMSVMFAFSLYRYGLAEEGWRILEGLFTQSQDFSISQMYPGIPEYFNPRGRGVYPYLTGSAAWYIFTMLTQVFGVRGELGDLRLEPKLAGGQFSGSDRVSVRTTFAGTRLQVIYANLKRLSYGAYRIGKVFINDVQQPDRDGPGYVKFKREEVQSWPDQTRILVELIAK
jgi:cellobiose phosphorylase